MQCPICWANTVGFIGTDCRCGDAPDPQYVIDKKPAKKINKTTKAVK